MTGPLKKYSWPEPTGPHDVGIFSLDLTDNSRFTTIGPEPMPYRRIHVYAWYPATADGRESRPYFTTQEALVLPVTLNRLYGMSDNALGHCRNLSTCSLPDAPSRLFLLRTAEYRVDGGARQSRLRRAEYQPPLREWWCGVCQMTPKRCNGGRTRSKSKTSWRLMSSRVSSVQ